MLDERGEIIYVGKAKSLRKRVAAYAKPQALTTRLLRMVALTRSMEFVTTGSEVEALLLEANLIKRHRPTFNIVLRDDKSFPYLYLRHDHAWPMVGKQRGAKREGREYFGPFASAGAVNETLNALLRAFPLQELLRQHLREPKPALPAIPDQALHGALRRPHRARRLCAAGGRGAGVPDRAVERDPRAAQGADGGGLGSAATSRRPPRSATA